MTWGNQTIISYDPGLITGVAEGFFSDEEPLKILGAGVVSYEDLRDGREFIEQVHSDHVVSELFTSRTNNPFAPDLTGVRVEGMLDSYYGGRVVWRERTKKSQVPDQILHDHGIWRTGADVDWEDGRDANDAIIHMIGYVAFDLNHLPTLRKYFR
jgi:hypothetical protein